MTRRQGLGGVGLAGLLAITWVSWAMIGPRATGGIEDLPVRWIPPTPAIDPAEPAIVWLTSDSGWLRLNTRLPESMASDGYDVVVWNSLRYYMTRKSPETAAADLSTILGALRDRGHEQFYLIGYSFGAGVLPFLVNRLPADDRAAVLGVALLAYPGEGVFRFSPEGWFGGSPPDALHGESEVALLEIPILCAAGETDPIRDCRSIASTGADIHLHSPPDTASGP